MKLNFTKMHGLGNDFVVLNGLEQQIELGSAQARFISDRHIGIGCDQILLIEPAENTSADIRMRIFNSDGSEVQQCGNGARCVAEYVYNNIADNKCINIETVGGMITVYRDGDDAIRVNMGNPEFEPDMIPLRARHRSDSYRVDLEQHSFEIYVLSMGNPHAVLVVADVAVVDVETIARQLQSHNMFPQSVNVGFMQVLDRNTILLRVYERGAGETLACGTGACAAVVAGIQNGILDKEVSVRLRLGSLIIRWEGEHTPVWMTGPATTVYEGNITI